MTFTYSAVARTAARRASHPICQKLGQTSSAWRCLSSKAESQPTASTSKHPEGYVNLEHKRKLVSLYHKSENFVTRENLSAYIDKEFTKPYKESSGSRVELGKGELERELYEKRENAAKWVVSPEASDENLYAIWRAARQSPGTGSVRKSQTDRLKAALYGVDEGSMKTSAEMVEKYQRAGSLDIFEEEAGDKKA